MADVKTAKNAYDALGLGPDDLSTKNVTTAFEKISRMVHPDMFAEYSSTKGLGILANKAMKNLEAAKKILDEEAKQAADLLGAFLMFWNSKYM